MENGTNINKTEYVNNILNNLNHSSNKELLNCLDLLSNEFESTKEKIILMTKYVDDVELIYDKILKEYQKRTKSG